MSEAEWDDTSWATQRALLEGLENDESVPFGFEPAAEAPAGPRVRENVDAGMSVIDLAAMRAQLEAARAARAGGSGGEG